MATTNNSTSQSMGIVNHYVARLTTDAATAAAHTLTVGFTPRVVRIHNLTDRISDEWFEGMADASSLHTIATGVRTLETSAGITVNDTANSTDGYSVTFPAGIMVASKVFAVEIIG